MVKVLALDPKAWIKKPGQKTITEFLNMTSITNLDTNKTFFVPCDCGSEVLMIEYDHETRTAEFAIFETRYAYRYKMSLWQRLRYIWQVLVHKRPYADQTILGRHELANLKSFLSTLDLK